MAASFIHVRVQDDVSAFLKRGLVGFDQATVAGLRSIGTRIRTTARRNARTVLHKRTGRGAEGIKSAIIRLGEGRVAVKIWPSVGYLSAHELGSAIPAATITARAGRVLHWQVGGEDRFARFVHRPAFTLPRRPFLSPAFAQHEAEIPELLDVRYRKLFGVESA